MRKFLAAALTLFFCTAAHAQNPGTVTNHAFALGKGAGVAGYTSLLCGSAQLAVGQNAADPICRTITGDATLSAAGALTLGTVNANVGTFGSTSQCASFTVNAKGLITAASQSACVGNPGGISGQVQFNNAGAFGGFTVSGDATLNTATGVLTLATVNSNVGSFGGATQCVSFTTNGKGLVTAASAVTCTPAIANVTGLGSGVLTALQTNVGSAGAFVVNGGAGGTPSSLTLTNATGLPPTGLSAVTFEAQGRLTLQANTPVMASSQSNVGTLRYDCYVGNLVPYYNGTTDLLDTITSCEVTDVMVSAASAGQVVANNVYDVFWVHGGANRICLAMSTNSGGGGGWSADTGGSNTARGTGFSAIDRTTRPYATNKNSITNCFNGSTNYGPVSANQGTYLGTIYATANGQTSWNVPASGVAGLWGVWNMSNRVVVAGSASDSTSSWSYSSATIRQSNGGTVSQIQFVTGLPEDSLVVNYMSLCNVPQGGGFANTGFALDSTTTFDVFVQPQSLTAGGIYSAIVPVLKVYAPQIGFHKLSSNESTDGVTTVTFLGTTRQALAAQLKM